MRGVPDAQVRELRPGAGALHAEAAVGVAADGGTHRDACHFAVGAGRPGDEPAGVGGEGPGGVAARLAGGGPADVGGEVPRLEPQRVGELFPVSGEQGGGAEEFEGEGAARLLELGVNLAPGASEDRYEASAGEASSLNAMSHQQEREPERVSDQTELIKDLVV